MDCACLVHKINGLYHYKKRVYVQIIITIDRRYFRWRQHGPARKCIYPKNKPTKNARNNGNLTKRTSELHETAINSKKKIAMLCVLEKNVGKTLISVEDLSSKAIVEPKPGQ